MPFDSETLNTGTRFPVLLLGLGLTFTSPVLDGCWMGWPSCFSVLGFRPQVLTEGVLSGRTRSQPSYLKPFSFPSSPLKSSTTPPGSLPSDSPSHQVSTSSYPGGKSVWSWAVPCCCPVRHLLGLAVLLS